MQINFFDAEVTKAQERFNQTFGVLTVCDLKQRQSAIVAICLLGRSSEKIKIANTKDEAREEIKKFMRIRKVLNSVFTQIETELNERRNHGGSDIRANHSSNKRSKAR